MILLTILILTLLLLGLFIISAVSVGGATVVLIFGDVIVCMALIGLLIYWLIKRRHR